MAVINIDSIFEYGRPTAVLSRVTGLQSYFGRPCGASSLVSNGRMKVMAKSVDIEEKTMDVHDEVPRSAASPAMSEAVATGPTTSDSPDLPISLISALQLTFTMLTHTLKNPIGQPHGLSRSSLNPYITLLLTFLSTVLKDKLAERVLARDSLRGLGELFHHHLPAYQPSRV